VSGPMSERAPDITEADSDARTRRINNCFAFKFRLGPAAAAVSESESLALEM
jgi:hypothetical protein